MDMPYIIIYKALMSFCCITFVLYRSMKFKMNNNNNILILNDRNSIKMKCPGFGIVV